MEDYRGWETAIRVFANEDEIVIEMIAEKESKTHSHYDRRETVEICKEEHDEDDWDIIMEKAEALDAKLKKSLKRNKLDITYREICYP